MSKIDPKFHPNLCPAGGALVHEFVNPVIYNGKRKSPNDIDLFLVGLQDDELELFVAEFMYSFGALFMCTRTAYSLNLSYICISPFDDEDESTHKNEVEFEQIMKKYDGNRHKDPPKIQIILRSYASPSEVVTGFDLDASGLCYYMGKYYATPRAMYALENMILTFDVDRFSTTYNVRMLKYMKEKGFMTYIPIPIAVELFSEIPRVLPTIHRESVHQNTLIGFLAMEVYSTVRSCQVSKPADYDVTDKVFTKTKSKGGEECAKKGGDNSKDEAPISEVDLLSRSEFEALSEEQQSELCSSQNQRTYLYFDQQVYDSKYENYYTYSVRNYVHHYIYRGSGSSRKLIGYTVEIDGDKKQIAYLLDFPPLNVIDYQLGLPSRIEFVTSNPGSQLTGSFNPVTVSWLDWVTITL
jgi:hypothetical protein